MSAKILPLFLLLSTLSFSQNLPDAPQPKSEHKTAPAQTMRFLSPVKRHPRITIASGFAAAVTSAIVLSLRNSNKTHIVKACACPAEIPKK